MKNSNLITIIICIIIAVIAFYFALYLYNDKMYKDIKDTFGEKNGDNSMKESFYHFNPLSSPGGKYSEPSLTCQLARGTKMNRCTLTTGRAGRCSSINSECVEIPYIDLPVRDNYHAKIPIGEVSPDCAYRNICARSDGEFGVCMSGWCYPSAYDVR
jgi:hypothetical protein